jgi:hypothetical protein
LCGTAHTSVSALVLPGGQGERSSLLEGKRSVSTGSGRGVSKPHSQLWEVVKCWDLVHNTGRMFATSRDRNKETAALNGKYTGMALMALLVP